MIASETETLIALLADCFDDPDLFNTAVLNRPSYWSGVSRGVAGQLEWSQAIATHRVVCVESGNSLGKDFLIGGLVPWWLWTRPDGLVIVTGPSQTLLGSVTWKEVRRAIERCPFVATYPEVFGADLSQGIKTSPQTVLLEAGWQALAYSTTSVERASGQHAEHLMVIVTEASGIEEEIGQALDSLKAEKIALFGNPIRPDGWFVDYCDQGDQDAKQGVPDREAVVHFNVPSTASPDAEKESSPYGLADKTWLEGMARRYGRDSLWYRVHVLAIRPTLSTDLLISPEHLDPCTNDDTTRAVARLRTDGKGGKRRLGCDVGEGCGNARTVVFVRDDLGILECHASRYTSPSAAAEVMGCLQQKWQVREEDCSYDGAGQTGKRLGNALVAKGLLRARPYFGSSSGGKRCANLRTATALALARRLDPDHYRGPAEPWQPFQIPITDHWPSMREELLALRYELKGDKSALEAKEDLMDRLGRSPDFADALTQTFRDEAVKG